jgi:glycosyltransferase involved in cell wall biosynthesis
MKVSIIIPVYNVEPYIERCLLSALNQTYQNLEIILIDDCGQDNSMSVASTVAENHPNGHKVVFLKHEQNRGLSSARNTGINAATGDYVYFLDSDDAITLDCIETLVNESEGFDVVVGAISYISKNKSDNRNINKNNIFLKDDIKNAYINDLIYHYAWNKLIYREFLLKNDLFFMPGLLHEDYLWTFMVTMKCEALKIIEKETYLYTIRENSLTTNFTIKNIHSFITGFNIIESFLIQDSSIKRKKYVWLIKYKFGIKNMSMRTNISYSDFRDLCFKNISHYPIFICNYSSMLKNIVLHLPVCLQYSVFKINKFLSIRSI